MSLFRDIVKLWNSDDLLSQAWDESYEMMVLSNQIFNKAIRYLRENQEIDAIKDVLNEFPILGFLTSMKYITHERLSSFSVNLYFRWDFCSLTSISTLIICTHGPPSGKGTTSPNIQLNNRGRVITV